jgi:hypothetical protein
MTIVVRDQTALKLQRSCEEQALIAQLHVANDFRHQRRLQPQQQVIDSQLELYQNPLTVQGISHFSLVPGTREKV